MENISKIVVCKSEGFAVGYVLDLAMDNFTRIGYVVVDEETENEYLLRNENILSVSEKYVLIEDVVSLEFLSQNDGSVLGLEVLDESGFSLGQIDSLKFQKNKCEKIITKKCEILPKFVKKIGKNFIFVSFKKNKTKKNKNLFPRNDVIANEVKIQKVAYPEKVSLSSQAYIGKVCLQDVFGYNNERLVTKGVVVTKALLEKVKQHNRLNQLFFALKRD